MVVAGSLRCLCSLMFKISCQKNMFLHICITDRSSPGRRLIRAISVIHGLLRLVIVDAGLLRSAFLFLPSPPFPRSTVYLNLASDS